ncbi:uL22 family ribosomal protein [Candidatus Saccharibacteria bacterium]|nr:uL22 family ribosomal protein [Candidatus Saccharibacteria bacterium]
MAEEYVKAHAMIKGVSEQPRKASLVASLVRQRTVADAVVILDHTQKGAAKAVKKAILSAEANLMQKYRVQPGSTIINRLSVSAGTRMRRAIPASRGRALPYEIIRSNIFVEVIGLGKAAKSEAKVEKADEGKEKEGK